MCFVFLIFFLCENDKDSHPELIVLIMLKRYKNKNKNETVYSECL